MNDEIFIKPAPGCAVRDPVTMALLAEHGEQKPRSPYWLRRLRLGDVVYVSQENNATEEADANAATPESAGKRRAQSQPTQSGDEQ